MLFENIPPLPKLQLPLFYGAYNQEAKSCGLLGSYRIIFDAQKSPQQDGWDHRAESNHAFDTHAVMQHIEKLKQRAFPDAEALVRFCESGVPQLLPDYFGNKTYGYITSVDSTTLFCHLTPDNRNHAVEVQCYDTGTLRLHLEHLEKALQQSQTVRFYHPISADYFPLLDSEFGDNERAEYPTDMDGYELAHYQEAIQQRIGVETLPEETARGLFAFYDKDDSLYQKMVSAKPMVEVIGDRLWAVAECQVVGELTAGETAALADYWQGQMSDGWGEGFEQRGIPSGQEHIGELYVHFWQYRDWQFIDEETLQQTQQQGQQMV